MAVPGETHICGAVAVFEGKLLLQEWPRGAQALAEGVVTAGVGVVIQLEMRLIQRVFHLRAAEAVFRKRIAQ